jgi:hypothetical protein
VPLEKRTRVEIFLPVRADLNGYRVITDWLAEELAYARGGSTLTTPFTGLYTSAVGADIIRDDIHLLFCDFDLDTDNPDHRAELSNYLNELRMLLVEAMNEEEIWIVFHQVTRVAGA